MEFFGCGELFDLISDGVEVVDGCHVVGEDVLCAVPVDEVDLI